MDPSSSLAAVGEMQEMLPGGRARQPQTEATQNETAADVENGPPTHSAGIGIEIAAMADNSENTPENGHRADDHRMLRSGCSDYCS